MGLQDGPLPVISGVITPVSRAITPQLPIHFRSFIGVIAPVVTGVRNHVV